MTSQCECVWACLFMCILNLHLIAILGLKHVFFVANLKYFSEISKFL